MSDHADTLPDWSKVSSATIPQLTALFQELTAREPDFSKMTPKGLLQFEILVQVSKVHLAQIELDRLVEELGGMES